MNLEGSPELPPHKSILKTPSDQDSDDQGMKGKSNSSSRRASVMTLTARGGDSNVKL